MRWWGRRGEPQSGARSKGYEEGSMMFDWNSKGVCKVCFHLEFCLPSLELLVVYRGFSAGVGHSKICLASLDSCIIGLQTISWYD